LTGYAASMRSCWRRGKTWATSWSCSGIRPFSL
jgi:hypothetical protein